MTTTIAQASLPELQRRLKAVQRELEAAMPTHMQEYLLLQEVIAQRQNNSAGGEFSTIRSPQTAVKMVLMENGDFMTKEAILKRLIAGGYDEYNDEETRRWTINDCINYYLRSKFLVKRGGEKWETEVGFPQWLPGKK